jgi:hypothetical protein
MFSAVKKKMNGKQEKLECYIEKNGFGRSFEPTEKWIKLPIVLPQSGFPQGRRAILRRTASP